LSTTNHLQIRSLNDFSTRLGENPLLVQAGTGNTSVKVDGTLWIKASGTWLAHANREQIFVPADLMDVKRCFRQNLDYTAETSAEPGMALSPSVETSMHAVVPHRVTVHVHSVNTIAWAVRHDAKEQIAQLLDPMHWKWIPYVLSGNSLAREVQRVFSRFPNTEVIVLGNHGLLIGAVSCTAAEAVLREVEQRLAIIPVRVPEPDTVLLGWLTCASPWRLPADPAVHVLATDPVATAILAGGILYPCQEIFLGPAAPILQSPDSLAEAASRYETCHGRRPAYFVVKGVGVIVHESATLADLEILSGFAEVVRRIPESAALRYLTDDELLGVRTNLSGRYREATQRHMNATLG